MTPENRDVLFSGHPSPCDDLKEMIDTIREMNLRYVEDITGIRGDIKTIKEYITNHWYEMREIIKEQKNVNLLVHQHEDIFKMLKEKKMDIHWGITIIAGFVGSLPAIVMVIIVMLKK